MAKRIKKLAFRAAQPVGTVAGRLLYGSPLTVLMYHSVTADPPPLPDWCIIDAGRFADQMRWLAAAPVDVRPLAEALTDLTEGRLRQPTIAITFDDGYRNNVTVALPILQRYRLPATIFLATGVIDTARTLWPNRLIAALAATDARTLDWGGQILSLVGRNARTQASMTLQRLVKDQAGDDPGRAVAAIEARLGQPVDPAVRPHAPWAMMGSPEIACALSSGLIAFGGHTVSHPILSQLDAAKLTAEIDGSIDAVAALTGTSCRTFAFPNGRVQDVDDRAVARLQKRGIVAAVTTIPGPNLAGADALRLRRWGIGAGTQAWQFQAKATNVHPTALSTRLRRLRGGQAA